jgi:DNA-binding NarL/FixJ family response regulator
VSKFRVLLAATPPLLAALLTDLIQRQGDMELVGKTGFERVDLLLAVRECEANVVIMPLTDSVDVPGIFSHLLAEYPELLILVLPTKSEYGFVYHRQGISKRPVMVATGDSILKAIRAGNPSNMMLS